MKKLYIILFLFAAVSVRAAEIKTMKGDFTQIREQAMFADPQESKGHFHFIADSLLRWEYTEPASFGIIADTKGVKLIRNGQISTENAPTPLKSMVSMIMQIISGIDTDNTQFNVVSAKSSEGTILTLTPKKRSSQNLFIKMEITLDQTDIIARQVKMYEKSGDTTTIIFSNIKLN